MAKTAAISIRLPQEKKDALEAAAVQDSRSVAAMAEMILTAWLSDRGFLKPPAAKPKK